MLSEVEVSGLSNRDSTAKFFKIFFAEFPAFGLTVKQKQRAVFCASAQLVIMTWVSISLTY